jgi:two-component system, cell cycle response regulator DivK
MTMPHVLIIDDNQNNIDVLALLLSREGVNHTAAQSARQVPTLVDQANQVDVVFLDLEFPNGDGFSLLQDLKAMPKLQGVPIVAYTVHISEIDVARRAGFDGFLGKPLDTQLFSEVLARILNGEQVWQI